VPATQLTGKPMSRAEVKEMIGKIADYQDEDLSWDESIVDLMKLVDQSRFFKQPVARAARPRKLPKINSSLKKLGVGLRLGASSGEFLGFKSVPAEHENCNLQHKQYQ
jgi:hypothetical protein